MENGILPDDTDAAEPATAEPDPAPLLSTKARRLAVEAVVACFSEAEADGFQQAEDTGVEWLNHAPQISEANDYGFVMTIGGKRIWFQAHAEQANGRRAKARK